MHKMGRHPIGSEPQTFNLAEEYINDACTNAILQAMTLHEVQTVTQQDPSMQALARAIKMGQWSDSKFQEHKKVKDELSIHDDTILSSLTSRL